MAKFGSSSMARFRCGTACSSFSLLCSAWPKVKACNASSDDVVACSRGVANFCTEPIDSPSFCRRFGSRLVERLQHLLFTVRLYLVLVPANLRFGRSPRSDQSRNGCPGERSSRSAWLSRRPAHRFHAPHRWSRARREDAPSSAKLPESAIAEERSDTATAPTAPPTPASACRRRPHRRWC